MQYAMYSQVGREDVNGEQCGLVCSVFEQWIKKGRLTVSLPVHTPGVLAITEGGGTGVLTNDEDFVGPVDASWAKESGRDGGMSDVLPVLPSKDIRIRTETTLIRIGELGTPSWHRRIRRTLPQSLTELPHTNAPYVDELLNRRRVTGRHLESGTGGPQKAAKVWVIEYSFAWYSLVTVE